MERLRREYRPEVVRVLFVGESPPVGGTFFYKGDSNLARHTREAFTVAFNMACDNAESFLRFFKDMGCYLDDLCLVPVNRLDDEERDSTRIAGIEDLAQRIRSLSPHAVVAVMRGIAPHVGKATRLAGLEGIPFHSLPFPTMGNQVRYMSGLVDLLYTLQRAGILPSE
jgi:hypothetical protein